jgi:UDP-4-amino-4,6-dideoxy-N-acetyl-beta-L-altrosamine transaminase
MDFISYGRQCIEEDDIAAVVETLKSDFLTCGPKVAEFERGLAAAVGAKYAVAVANGTAALHIAALSLGLKAGDEVITTPLTFAASANCILYCGATPVFADICPHTMLLDVEKVREKITPKTKAIIPVHYGGELCNMDEFTKLAEEHGLSIIQDCAHSLGGKTCGKHQGEYAGMQTWSFHPVKTITTGGEGGAVTTNDEELYKKLLRLRTHGITRDKTLYKNENENGGWHYEMLELGFNYRLTDIQCALGITQLKKLPRFIKRRQEIVQTYNEAFINTPVKIQHTPKWSSPARHLYTIRLNKKHRRHEAYNALLAKNIGVNVHYIPTYLMPHYQSLGYTRGICPIAEDSYERLITLPLHPVLTDEQVGYVVNCVKEVAS